MSRELSATQEVQKARVARAPRGDCAEAGPYGVVCTLPRTHDWSCYDAGDDSSFNSRWLEDFGEVPLSEHPFDCRCPPCRAVV
jgi:hypothetical protein